MVYIVNSISLIALRIWRRYVPNIAKDHIHKTQDRFLKSKGVIRGRYAYAKLDNTHEYYYAESDKYFCSQSCKLEWLSTNMTNIEQGRPIEFIRHRREEDKVKNEDRWVNIY